MTIEWGDTGRASIGSLKTLNISPYVNEQNIISTALPTGSSSTLPGGITAAVSYTINTSTMTPTFSGVSVLNYKPLYGINISGQNTSGASQTLYYQLNKNGTSYLTGNASITNNNYFTVTICAGFLNNDKLDLYIWTPATSGMNYFYSNIFCQASRVNTGSKYMVNVTYTTVSLASNTYFPLTGKVGVKNQSGNYVYPASTTGTFGLSNTGTTTFNLLYPNSTFNLFAMQAGDAGGTYNDIGQSSTNYPLIDCSYLVSSISYRDLFF